ncbi:MAG: Omp28-related outer membrane protein [Odoribacter sp.]|nr:Omp28-related outer membrane protein [Odoribacter sp.]MDY3033826.1 Omp28-related outer membrane protein [Odoribacter sp.]
MKQIFFYVLCFLTVGMFACSDDDSEGGLQLKVNRNTMLATGTDEVRFTVFQDGNDVTAQAVIKEIASGETLVNGVFTTTIAGTYSFVAEYAGAKSEAVVVEAEKGEGFKKNVLVMKFTAIGCQNCPRAEHAILDAEKEVPGRICPVSVYGTLGSMKDFMIEEYINSFQKYFQFNEYPHVMIDHSSKWNFMTGIKDMAFEKALRANGEVGIALETELQGDALKVKVKVKGSKSIDYSTNLVVAVLENNLYAKQTGAETEADNYHNHVVRRYLTDLYGNEYKIASGTLNATDEYVKTFDYKVPAEFKKENLEILVYVLKTSDRSCLNCRNVLVGKKVDYETL